MDYDPLFSLTGRMGWRNHRPLTTRHLPRFDSEWRTAREIYAIIDEGALPSSSATPEPAPGPIAYVLKG